MKPEGFTRRGFLKAAAAAGAGLTLAVELGGCVKLEDRADAIAQRLRGPLPPTAFVRIGTDGAVTIWITKSEMGQGVRTSLAMLLAEELDADWATVKVQSADYDPRFPDMVTGGSSSVSDLWMPLRRAGGQVREMLMRAAAKRWKVPVAECRTSKGAVTHEASGRRLAYGELALAAAEMPVPDQPRLKAPSEFALIGTAVPSLDGPDRVSGKARFGIDTVVPGMRYATIARSPELGGRLTGYEGAAARAVSGVIGVHEVTGGVAVVATSTWAALKGREAVGAKWTSAAGSPIDSAAIGQQLRDRAAADAPVAFEQGDTGATLAGAARTVTADYELPFLAHAPMEPMNCTARVDGGRCEVWAPAQNAGDVAAAVARRLGVASRRVTVHVTLLGGAFGRRLISDYAAEAAEISRAAGVPIKLTWSREDDIRHDLYRPASAHRLAAGLDAAGRPVAWHHRVATPSIDESLYPGSTRDGLDPEAVRGAAGLPYRIPNIRVEYAMTQTPVPVLWWRSVYASQNVFATECFADEVAHAAGRDPVDFRRALLAQGSRERGVLDLVAEKSGWGRAAPGRFQGVALHHFFSDTVVAEVAEVSVTNGRLRVHRVVCAVDCGTVVNPDGARAQITGGVLYGLSAALYGEITVSAGQVVQSNFHDYRVLRMNEAPEVEVHFVPGDASPVGLGEPAVPPVAPAVANAIFAATGKRVRKLPVQL
jgi:isoquinoline 1-oxidoreductase beta subunit